MSFESPINVSPEGSESVEKSEKGKYIFTDSSGSHRKLFECKAITKLEAEEAFLSSESYKASGVSRSFLPEK